MKVFAFSLNSAVLAVAVLLLAAGVVAALPSPETAITPNEQSPHESRFPPLHITGSINGVTLDHFGSVQEVFAQLDAEDNSFKLADIDAMIKSSPTAIHTVEKREMTDINCSPLIGQNYNDAHGKAILDGIDYLHTGWLYDM